MTPEQLQNDPHWVPWATENAEFFITTEDGTFIVFTDSLVNQHTVLSKRGWLVENFNRSVRR